MGKLALEKTSQKSWQGFENEDPVLVNIRSQMPESGSCREWATALLEENNGILPIALSSEFQKKGVAERALANWGAEKDEAEIIEKCDDLPCKVKLNESEVNRMKQVSRSER